MSAQPRENILVDNKQSAYQKLATLWFAPRRALKSSLSRKLWTYRRVSPVGLASAVDVRIVAFVWKMVIIKRVIIKRNCPARNNACFVKQIEFVIERVAATRTNPVFRSFAVISSFATPKLTSSSHFETPTGRCCARALTAASDIDASYSTSFASWRQLNFSFGISPSDSPPWSGEDSSGVWELVGNDSSPGTCPSIPICLECLTFSWKVYIT